jgi:hypothetical protein
VPFVSVDWPARQQPVNVRSVCAVRCMMLFVHVCVCVVLRALDTLCAFVDGASGFASLWRLVLYVVCLPHTKHV